MAVNNDKPHLWKADVAASVDLYNQWFLKFAPPAFRGERAKTAKAVKSLFSKTASLTSLTPQVLHKQPAILPALRMATCPPLARDRLIGLSGVNGGLVRKMEKDGALPPRMSAAAIEAQLSRICETIRTLLDPDMLPWIKDRKKADARTLERGASVIADRLCGAQADPIIRNAQEQRQLELIETWLTRRGYKRTGPHPASQHPNSMPAGTFAFRMNVRVVGEDRKTEVNIPIDAVIQPKSLRPDKIPILVEAKSAGDFTNVNKRRKEEATKMRQLRARFGPAVPYVLFLCGYFDAGYLGYEASEGIDWVWEHRMDDLSTFGL